MLPRTRTKPREEIFEENKTKPAEKSYAVYIVIGAVILILCLIVVIIALVRKRKFAALPDSKKVEKLFFAGRKKLCGRDFSDHTPEGAFESIKKTFGADMAEKLRRVRENIRKGEIFKARDNQRGNSSG